MYPENDYRYYLMHWGFGKESKNHKYVSRYRGKNGDWVYIYNSPKKNSKEDGVHQRIPKGYKEKGQWGKGDGIHYPETERSNATMEKGKANARKAQSDLVKAKRNERGETDYTSWNSNWQKNARKAKREYKKRKRKATINKILSAIFT